MKKLVIVAFAVAMATASNAAAIKWSTGYEIADATASGVTSATIAYLIDSSALTQTSIYSAVSAGKTLAEALGSSYVASAAVSGGLISMQSLDRFSAGDSKTLYMIVYDSNIGDNGALYFSEQLTKTLSGTGSVNYSFDSESSLSAVSANMTGFNASSGGWVAVPEPTSAMLLMLGLCGLALKHKNA